MAGVSDVARVLSGAQDEAELVTELQSGSDRAFDWLLTHYHALVYNLILGMLSDAADAADTTQEVFLKAFRGINRFRQGSSLKTWLYRIAIREALNHRRWWRRHRRPETSIDAEVGCAPLELEDLGATPFDELASREVQAIVRRALVDVADVFRSAVILRDLEGLSYEEVAEVLGVSVGTVKSRILRGRRALREILAPVLNGKGAENTASKTGCVNGSAKSSRAQEGVSLVRTMYPGGADRSLRRSVECRQANDAVQVSSSGGGSR